MVAVSSLDDLVTVTPEVALPWYPAHRRPLTLLLHHCNKLGDSEVDSRVHHRRTRLLPLARVAPRGCALIHSVAD